MFRKRFDIVTDLGTLAGGLFLLLAVVFVCGCQVGETNEAACQRMFEHVRSLPCSGLESADADELEGIDEFVDSVCAAFPETAECDIPAFADCVMRNFECDGTEFVGDELACENVISIDACTLKDGDFFVPFFGPMKAFEPESP